MKDVPAAEAILAAVRAIPRGQVAGYGEYRPIVPNAAKGGAEQNRRVEIFLVPMPDHLTPVDAPAAANAERAGDEPMK